MPRKFEPTEKQLKAVQRGAEKGLTEEEIAKSIKIAYSTFKKYKQLFADVLKKGREAGADKLITEVESQLQKNIKGFFVTEETIEEYGYFTKSGKWVSVEPFKKKGGETSKELQANLLAKRKLQKKYIKPSETSLFFFLVNRAGDRWQSVNNSAKDNESNKGAILKALENMVDAPDDEDEE